MFFFSLSIGLTPSTWRHLLPVAMIMWQCTMDGIPWHLCLGNSVVQCFHPIYSPLPTSFLLSSGQMPVGMGLAGGLLTVRHLVGVTVFVMSQLRIGYPFQLKKIVSPACNTIYNIVPKEAMHYPT